MNLVDDFNDVYRSAALNVNYPDPPISRGLSFDGTLDSLGADNDLVIVDHPSTSTGPDIMPLLSVDTTIRQAARGRGRVACVCCCNDSILVATSRGFLLRYTWDDYGNEKVTEVEVSKLGDIHIQSLFLDPTGCHALVLLRCPGGMETHYAHRRWTRSKPLSKLKGVTITAVGWSRRTQADETPDKGGTTSSQGTGVSVTLNETCTGPVLLGTNAGVLLELVVEEHQKKDQPVKMLLDFKDKRRAPICAVFQEDCSTEAPSSQPGSTASLSALGQTVGRKVVIVATPNQMFLFEGSAHLETLFAPYAALPAANLSPCLEAVSPGPSSQLHLYASADSSPGAPLRFAWLVGSVVYHGQLVLDPAAAATAAAAASTATAASTRGLRSGGGANLVDGGAGGVRSLSPGLRPSGSPSTAAGAAAASADATEPFLRNVSSLPLVDAAGSAADEPRSLVMTEFHFLVLAADRLQAINRVSGRVVHTISMKSPMSHIVSGDTISHEIVALLRDDLGGGKLFMHSDESLMEVSMHYEARDMWRVYLELKDWEQSLRLCSSQAQRDEVLRARAEAAVAAGDFCTAAVNFAKIQGGKPAFEDVALQLIDAPSSPEPLQLYLSTRLGCLARSDRAQATMLATWLTELYLDQINKALLEAGGQLTEQYTQSEEQLRTLLREQVDVLDISTTVTLLATYGRLEDLLHYATARGDNEAVLEYLVKRPGGASRVFAVLRKPNVGQELVYKFAPALVAAAPQEAVDFFMAAKPTLDPRRLIPALLRFGEPAADPASCQAVLRYVEFAADVLVTTDSALHNLGVALHALDQDEHALLSYLQRARDALGRPYFDAKYALRMATERRKPRACVKLLCELGMFEDAVQLALQQDLELAKLVASQPEEGEEALKRKLWLAVARHVVQAHPTMDADQAATIKQAVDFLREAGGLLKIEDILPFFPDFVTIDNFKDAICESLEHYNQQIEDLKREMAEATDIAEAVRSDLKLLSTRSATVSLSTPCTRCHRPLGDLPLPCGLPSGGAIPPFFLFPTGLAYHGTCCAAELFHLVAPAQQKKVRDLMERLSKVKAGQSVVPPTLFSGREEPLRSVQNAFVEEVGGEDPRNGEVGVRLVDLPFVKDTAEDAAELASWRF